MKIHFLAGRCIPVEADSLNKRPLGGTETALIRVAECLATRGHEVTIFSSHQQPTSLENPRYLNIRGLLQAGEADVAIAVQDWWCFYTMPVRAKQRALWTGDAGDQYMNFGIGDRRVARLVNPLLLVSNWQKQHLSAVSGYPEVQTRVIYNGVHTEWFTTVAPERKAKRLIFTSSPYRGLALTVPIYEKLLTLHPDAEFHVYAGLAVYDRDRPFEGPLQQEFAQIRARLETLPNCQVFGNVTQLELSEALKQASIFLYPSIFPETSCIAALEAQAAGCVPVVSDFAALPETIGDTGIIIRGLQAGSADYIDAFVAAIDRLFKNPEEAVKLSQAAREKVLREHSWERVTDRLLEAIHVSG